MLSVVLPTYDARGQALRSLAALDDYLAPRFGEYELVVVDDGSRPGERLAAAELPARAVLVELERNRGKGAAVRSGMLRARGDVRVFTDVDLPFDLSAIPRAHELIAAGGRPVVFGDRSLAASTAQVDLPLVRRATSRLMKKLVELVVVGGIGDSQCGLKAFRGAVAEALFPLVSIEGFAFDVEVYYLLLVNDVPITKIPVRLVRAEASSVAPLGDGLRMAGAVARLPVFRRLGRYRSPALAAFAEPPSWTRPQPGPRGGPAERPGGPA